MLLTAYLQLLSTVSSRSFPKRYHQDIVPASQPKWMFKATIPWNKERTSFPWQPYIDKTPQQCRNMMEDRPFLCGM